MLLNPGANFGVPCPVCGAVTFHLIDKVGALIYHYIISLLQKIPPLKSAVC